MNPDLEALKNKHPELYKSIVAIGVQLERDRVVGFFDLADEGPPNPGLRLAHSAIRSGEPMTPKYVRHYRQAARAVAEIAAYAEDSEAVEGATLNATVPKRMSAQERAVYNELVKLVGGGDIGVEDLEQG